MKYPVNSIRADLRAAANPERAKQSARFFKTGPGQYGEGDIFIGLTVPQQRTIAKSYYTLSLDDLRKLLHSKIHEERLTATIILVAQFKKADETIQKNIYDFYLANTKFINNWDIIDGSAEYIVGEYLRNKDKSVLEKLAQSDSIWERRIAMLSTFAYIKTSEYEEAFKIATILLHDNHDLIQKAVGWMLREIGKKSGEDIEEEFLQEHYKTMPRTMLRYAIERFPEVKRKAYLNGSA